MRRAGASLLLVAWLAGATPVWAGGTRDLADGWVVPAADLARALSGGEVASNAGAWVWLGRGVLYGLPDLPLTAAAGGWGSRRLLAAASWQRLGGVLLREDRLRVRCLLGGANAAGLSVGWDRLAAAGASSATAVAAAVELRFAGPHGTGVAASLPLTACPPWFGRGGVRDWLRLSGVSGAMAWGVALDRDGTGRPLLEAEADLALAPGAIGLRWEPATGSLGMTTAWRLRRATLRSSHLAHPALGLTHRWTLAYGAAGEAP